MRSILYAVIAVLLAALIPTVVSADQLTQTEDTSATDSEIDMQLRFLEARLDDSKLHGQLWWYGWLTINSAATLGGGLSAGLSNDHDDTVKNATNATKAAIGLGRMLAFPREARFGADRIRELPETTREEKLRKLHAAEDQLRRNA